MVDSAVPGADLQQGLRLDALNTLALPCIAAARLGIADAGVVPAALAWCRENGLPPLPLGECSNVILPPVLHRAVLCSTDRRIEEVRRESDAVHLRVGAGCNWHHLVTECLQHGFHGLENLALIPGTVGAAPIQNIGAYGVELEQFLDAVHAVDLRDGAVRRLDREDCEFAYRDSVFKRASRAQYLITSIELRLSLRPVVCLEYPILARRIDEQHLQATPQAVYESVVALRRERLPDPARSPNVGSFFQNPLVDAAQAENLQARFPGLPAYTAGEGKCKLSAAWMIDACGLRGVRLAGAGVSAEHALVLVNLGGGRDALLALSAHVASVVQERFGCRLHLEPTVISDE